MFGGGALAAFCEWNQRRSLSCGGFLGAGLSCLPWQRPALVLMKECLDRPETPPTQSGFLVPAPEDLDHPWSARSVGASPREDTCVITHRCVPGRGLRPLGGEQSQGTPTREGPATASPNKIKDPMPSCYTSVIDKSGGLCQKRHPTQNLGQTSQT